MKKPSQRLTFEERERLILEAATQIFSQRGFQGTTTKSLADRSGINEALLFRHFATKEALYTALLRNKLSKWTHRVLPDLEKKLPADLRAALKKIAQLVVSENHKDPTFLRMMLFSALENHELARLFFKQRLPLISFMEDFFGKRVKQRQVRRLDPAVLARTFFGLLHHYILVTQLFQVQTYYPLPEKKMLGRFVEIFVKGISP